MKHLFLLFTIIILTSCLVYSQQYYKENFLKNVNEKTVMLESKNFTANILERPLYKRPMFGLGAGANLPIGSFSDYHKTGWAGYGNIGYLFNENVGIRLDFQASGHYYKMEQDPTQGSAIATSDLYMYLIDANILFGKFSNKTKLLYYGITGIGYAIVNWPSYRTPNTLGYSWDYYYEGGSSGALQMKIGGGIGFRISENFLMVAEAQYRYISIDSYEKINSSIPIKIGVLINP